MNTPSARTLARTLVNNNNQILTASDFQLLQSQGTIMARTVFFDVVTEQQTKPTDFVFESYEFVVKNEAGAVVETLVGDVEDANTDLEAGNYTVAVQIVGAGDDRRFPAVTASFIVTEVTPETIGVPVSVSISVA